MVVEDLHGMHVPGWAKSLLCSYLTDKSMILTHSKAQTAEMSLPGGNGAGTLMGGLLFIVKCNGACLRPPISQPITDNTARQIKYIDDSTQMASINLNKSLKLDEVSRPRSMRPMREIF